MGDSDDEYDRKRRDKFRGERNEYRDGRRDDRRREDWIERESSWGRNRGRTDYRDYRTRDSRYSPVRSHDISPSVKRMRTDWDDRRFGHDSGYSSYNSWSHDSYSTQSSYSNQNNNQRDADVGQTQPPMMSFKAFLQTQDDNITDEDAIKKYNEYKLEFKRQQLNEFFVNHKEEEWFKIKYHPEDSVKRREEQLTALKNRVSVFMEFLEQIKFDAVSIDADQTEQLVRLLDAVVIRLEGGSDFDLQALNETSEKEEEAPPKVFVPGEEKDEKKKEREKVPSPPEPKKDPSQPLKLTITSEQVELQKKAKEFLKQKENCEQEVTVKKRKREYDFESGSDFSDEDIGERIIHTGNDETSPMEEEPPPPGLDAKEEPTEDEKPPEKEEGEMDTVKEEKEDEEEEEEEGETKGDEKTEDEEEPAEETVKKEEPEKEEEEEEEGAETESDKEKIEKEKEKPKDDDDDKQPKPRPLHKTASIFLRNLAPTITKQEVEAMCKRYPGFLRVAIADPQPERRWFRRGWVSFERHVNIKEICWNLNNIRLRDCELGAIVNRDLSRRIRTVNGITSHKQVVRHDIKLAAKIIQNLDAKWGLWADDEGEQRDPSNAAIPSFGLVSKNPALKNITDYLIEEASAEEEELLGHSADQEEGQVGEDTATIERDEALIKVLDRLLFYLRIVHSVDYYNHSEYPNEDEMPNRCGIMHARGIPPSSKVSQQEISDYCRSFEQKIASFLQPLTKILVDELDKLGVKDAETEVEKFIQANTQELAKDKWLCPLSGKKFKGPEFVRKHIFNKHAEKVEEVKKEVEYFNNYLRDAKRPQLPEHPGSRQQRKDSTGERETYSASPANYMQHYGYNYGASGGRHTGYSNNYGGYGGYNRDPYTRDAYSRPSRGSYNRSRGDYRPVIHYRDLDAPREPEEF